VSKLINIAKRLTMDDNVSLATLDSIEQLLGKVEEVCEELRRMKLRHHDEEKALRVKLRKIQDTCTHQVTTYHGDPSGGSDSSHTCDICQLSLDRSYRFT
jgi:hypothetical protein